MFCVEITFVNRRGHLWSRSLKLDLKGGEKVMLVTSATKVVCEFNTKALDEHSLHFLEFFPLLSRILSS